MRTHVSPFPFCGLALVVFAACQPATTMVPDGSDEGSSDPMSRRRDGAATDSLVPPSCDEGVAFPTLADPRQTDNACVFDRWLAQLPGLSPAEQRKRVDAYLATDDLGSRVPLRSKDRVIFLAAGPAAGGDAPRVAGSFSGWDLALGEMKPLLQTGYYYREEHLAPGRYAYKLIYDASSASAHWGRDPACRWLEWDGFDHHAPGEFNSVFYTTGATLDRGLLRLLPQVHSPELGNDREVYVYLPKIVFDAKARFPSLYVSDGNEYITRSAIDTVSDGVFGSGAARPAVLVFVPLHDQNERMDEYTFDTPTARGDKYRDFLAQTLAPRIDAGFPTLNDPAQRGVAGASLGGLISAYVAWGKQDRFGLVGSQSGSFFWPEPNQEHLTKTIAAAPKANLRFYLDNGTPDDNDVWNQHLADTLKQKGYDATHVVEMGGQHDWSYWAGRWPKLLAFLFAP